MKNNMNKKQIYGKPNYSDDVKKIAIISTVVIVVLLLVYFLTALASGEIKLGNKDNSKVKTEATIQYEEIIAGEVLNRNRSEYYVLFFDFTNDNASTLLSLKDQYGYVDKSLYMYIVDLDKSFNNILISDKEGNIIENPSTIDELKVNDISLLKIKDGKVVSRVTSYDNVKEVLEKLSK